MSLDKDTERPMSQIHYVRFNEIEPDEFLPILNKHSLRVHLIGHELFDINTVTAWINSKIDIDASKGCRVRAILVDNRFIGWCGIQLDEGKYGIAIVIDDSSWGVGKKIFREVMGWAKELGHETIFIQLLHTRPEYKFLRKMSKSVHESQLMGNKFTTYELEVS